MSNGTVDHEHTAAPRDERARTPRARATPSRIAAAAWATCVALPLAVVASGGLAAQPDATLQLARDRGCLVCHEVGGGPPAVAQALPHAPSFHDIAARYRRDPGAKARLVGVVVHGSQGDSGRHWPNQAAFTRMFPNELMVSDDEAQALVAWILAMR